MTIQELLKKNRKGLYSYITGAMLTIASNLCNNFALGIAFSLIEAKSSAEFWRIVIMTVIFAFLPIILQVTSRMMRIGFMRDILVQVRLLAYEKVMNQSIESFRKEPKENYMSAMASDINLFEKDFFLAILNIVNSFGIFIAGVSLLFYFNWLIGLIALIAALILYISVKYFEKPVRQTKEQQQAENARYTDEISNSLNGLEVIKLYRVEENFLSPFIRIVKRLERFKRRSSILDNSQMSFGRWVASSAQILVIIQASYLFVQGRMSLAVLVVVINLIGQISWTMVSAFGFINRLKASVDIYNRICMYKETEHQGVGFVHNDDLASEQLSFSYGDLKVLDQVSIMLEPNDKVLIHGPSGTGKTTLLNCLSQNQSGYTGNISLGNTPIDTIDHREFLEFTGYIRQKHFLFNDTIKHNIILNQPYDEERFRRVLEQAALTSWIDSLAEKENQQLVDDGSNVSGGQRQRISIARELYRECEILFVDEPSASLDDQTAREIYQTLLHLNKTVICVTHRHIQYLSQRFNKVIDLAHEGGRHVEEA